MNIEKLSFLQQSMHDIAKELAQETPAKWGVMNAHQMLEHLADFFDVSYEKIVFPLTTPEEHLPKYKEFLYSDKQFRENTKAPASVLGDAALPYRFDTLEDARQNLQLSVEKFIGFFGNHPGKTTLHPAFGYLTYAEWVLLHHKHVVHHFKQFGLID